MTIIEQSTSPTARYGKLAILATGLFVVGTNAFVVAGVLPQIASTFHVGPAQVGYTITLYGLVVAVVSPVIATAFGRVSRTVLMAAGLGVITLGVALTAASSTIQIFTVGRLVAALGGAALVPAATAAAPRLLPPEQRGRALTAVGLGFTLATALGAPAGTALAAVTSWRAPLAVVAVVAAVLAIAVATSVRGIPLEGALSARARLAVLGDRRVLLALLTKVFLCLSFNLVYFFSSVVAVGATGGSGALLAVLLLGYGVGGLVGTLLAGPITDRYGSAVIFSVAIVVEVVVFVLLVIASRSFPVTAILFGLWGAAGFGAGIPLQHRLVSIDPAVAGIALSWYNTALYLAIALAPVLGGLVLSAAAPDLPLVGAGVAVLALGTFQLTRTRHRPV